MSIKMDSSDFMKIFLVYPPWLEEETLAGYSRKTMKDVELITSPPLGLAYIASVLLREGHEVKIFDCQFPDQLQLLYKSLKKEKPQIVGVSLFTASVYSSFDLIRKIKKLSPRTKIVAGGPHAGAVPKHCLDNKDIDIVILGEGETTMKDICSKKKLNRIEGIAYRHKRKIKINRPRNLIRNLDSIPFPARELLPKLSRYRTEKEKLSREPYTSMMTSRGCPYRCTYCSKNVFGRTFRARSAKNVVDEMALLVRDFGIKHVHIYDDTFNANPKRVFDICNEIIKRKLDLTWDCEARVNTISKKMLRKMREAGCTMIGFGVESGDARILRILQKDVDLNKVKKAVKWAREVGIRTRCYFIIGSPEETWESVRRTIDFTKELNPDFVLFSILTPFPGTKIFEWLKQKKMIKEDEYVIRNVIQMGELTPDELRKALSIAYKEFYFRPKMIFNHLTYINNFFILKSYTRLGISLLRKYIID